MWVTQEDLLNKLFTAIVSTEDHGFVLAFFVTYRRFTSPREVLHDFLERFKEVESYAVPSDVGLWANMRYVTTLLAVPSHDAVWLGLSSTGPRSFRAI